MSTAQQIEEAIRALEKSEREKLLQHLPQLFPELGGDLEWARIIGDQKSRPGFSALVNSYEARLSAEPDAYPKVAESDFD
jgi:hypothetical protein